MGIRGTFAMGVAALALTPAVAAAAPTPQPYGTNSSPGFWDILPPGTNGRTNGAELAAFLTTGQRPRHNDDQRLMYQDLAYATPGLTAAQLPRFYKDSTFGVLPGQAERTYSPRSDVTILRDRAHGVPHVYGSTRAGAMFGLGYAAAEDRLFFIDVLRHLGRAELTTFAGGAPGNQELDAEQWAIAPYTEADLQRQVDQMTGLYGAAGTQVHDDALAYIAGINQYIAEAKLDPAKMPGEYAAIGRPLGPDPWKPTDIIATASLVGGIFGKGGGQELVQATLLQSLRAKFGDDQGTKLWREWAAYEDADAPTTVRSGRFPYQEPPAGSLTGIAALPDPGTLRPAEVSVTGGGSPTPAPPALPIDPGTLVPAQLTPIVEALTGTAGGLVPHSMSNALVVAGRRSASGHPLAVFGPQTGYFAPEILMEQDVHGPGIDARGAAFPGVNLYVQLGHGRDYAWSATSAGQDIIDTFAVPLCQDDDHYSYRGRCLAMEPLEKTNRWTPNLADQSPPGSQTLRMQRTKLGLVTARGRVDGHDVAFTQLRSTYFHEVDSALGFAAFNDPEQMRDAGDFQRAAAKIGYAFNWLYVDDRDIAYFNSGANPVRAAGVTGQLPTPADHEWVGYDPERWLETTTPFEQHPQLINGQDYITSWNNKQAAGFAGADSNLFSSVFRSDMLDQEIEARLKGGRKLRLPELVDAMEEGGLTDLRAERVLPLALEVIGSPREPKLADAVAKLRAWVADGGQRRDTDHDGAYEHSDAVRILDAWWPLWLKAEFGPVLGPDLFAQMRAAHELDNAPNNHGQHLGSAYQTGWYGYAYKDLRTVLGQPVKAPYSERYCGAGSRAACRAALESSLAEAIDVPNDTVYQGDKPCSDAGEPHDQDCYDRIMFRPLGGATQPLTTWMNRPTYQQAVEVAEHRAR